MEDTRRRIEEVRRDVTTRLGDRYGEIVGDHTVVVLTGSGGRGEMGAGSDLDGYVIRVDGAVDAEHDRALTDAIVSANEAAKLQPLDRAGEFLKMRDANDLIDDFGSPEDDARGALTIRVLFLLEGIALLGESAYETLLAKVQHAYRSTAVHHQDDFMPLVLINDLIRYWRIVLLNHEHRLREKEAELRKEGGDPETVQKAHLAHRRVRSYKLRCARCVTCFSALAYFLALAPGEEGNVSAEDERRIFLMTPIERLESLPEVANRTLVQVDPLLDIYERFLDRTDMPKEELIAELQRDGELQVAVSKDGRDFTKLMFELVQEVGQGGQLHRQMLI